MSWNDWTAWYLEKISFSLLMLVEQPTILMIRVGIYRQKDTILTNASNECKDKVMSMTKFSYYFYLMTQWRMAPLIMQGQIGRVPRCYVYWRLQTLFLCNIPPIFLVSIMKQIIHYLYHSPLQSWHPSYSIFLERILKVWISSSTKSTKYLQLLHDFQSWRNRKLPRKEYLYLKWNGSQLPKVDFLVAWWQTLLQSLQLFWNESLSRTSSKCKRRALLNEDLRSKTRSWSCN